jgi:2-polyprenyl-3-methyl-5-hydroxy-6-metoxy-1,4-benzoquinol methylase
MNAISVSEPERDGQKIDTHLESRARLSLGSSSDAIYRMVDEFLGASKIGGGTLVDVGCGGGALWRVVSARFARYCGLDAVRYEAFPVDGEFRRVNLDSTEWPVPAASGDVVVAIETIEHLENPWAFMRQLGSLAKPDGWVLVTTPNQTSVLSLLTLAVKHRFSAFQDAHYPAHKTALLASDLERAAREAGLDAVRLVYSGQGRVPGTAWHYPKALASVFPRALSDNLMLVSRKHRA